MSRVQDSQGYSECLTTRILVFHILWCSYDWQCIHHDLSLFKESFDARRTLPERGSLAGEPGGHLPAASPLRSSSHAPQQSSTLRQENTQRDIDLRGVSANPANTPFHPSSPTFDAADQDILSQLQPLWLSTASLTGHPRPYSAFPSQSTPALSRNPSLMLSSSALPVPLTNGPTDTSRYLPIGRQVSAALDVWECQWAHTSDGTESLSSFTEDGTGCLQQCGSLYQMSEHYRSAHGIFHEEDPPFMWKCRSCQFLNDRKQLCPHCRQPRSGWEKWYYGYVTVTDMSVSLPATSVQSSDKASGFAVSPSSAFSSHGYGYSGFTSFTTGCYSPGSGTAGPFLQRCLGALLEMVVGPFPSISSLYVPSLTLVLALASCVKANTLLCVCTGVVAAWAEDFATSIQACS